MDSEKLLKEGLNQIGFTYSEAQINAFLTYLSELKKWNKAYNLTALKTDEDIIIKHFLDSLLYLKAILNSELKTLNSELKIADIGTGAGFPGIPIKIMRPEIEVTLIESSRKKATFLRHIIRVLGLKGIMVLESQIENLGRNYQKTFDIILSRATFKITDFLKKVCPYVKENGILILSKGPGVSEEIGEIKAVEKILRFELPFIEAQRNLVILRC